MPFRRLAGNASPEYHAVSMTELLAEPPNDDLPKPSGNRSPWAAVFIVLALPLGFAAWWFLLAQPAGENAADNPPAEQTPADPDPWIAIQQPIFPIGRVASIHHTSEFTYILFRGEDRDRWVATSPTKFNEGDIVQLRVDPRAVKTNFPVNELGRVFPTLVLAGQAKLIREASIPN